MFVGPLCVPWFYHIITPSRIYCQSISVSSISIPRSYKYLLFIGTYFHSRSVLKIGLFPQIGAYEYSV